VKRAGRSFAGCLLETFKPAPAQVAAFGACQRVLSGESNGVVLIGHVGVGKTHLLVALANSFGTVRPVEEPQEVEVASASELIRNAEKISAAMAAMVDLDAVPVLSPDEFETRGHHVEYWPIVDLVHQLRSEIKTGEQAVSTLCMDCDLLLVDDFGIERRTEFVDEELMRIFDWRYRDLRAVAISTNLSPKEIQAKYGDRLLSRWVQQCEIIRIDAGDFRKGDK